ncbi:hypothetical protein IWQ60_002689 [Tieghemiomyces parasiticus]|uniref:Uncharacterized protein n=1 Tax=Tieghemiomyces parasiticus TaxID=78921 RepID=A0A9W8AC84_9FUNG|nr:hypothetical protein IWQ60_002689 [Tieghemiomyces parasiticus]
MSDSASETSSPSSKRRRLGPDAGLLVDDPRLVASCATSESTSEDSSADINAASESEADSEDEGKDMSDEDEVDSNSEDTDDETNLSRGILPATSEGDSAAPITADQLLYAALDYDNGKPTSDEARLRVLQLLDVAREAYEREIEQILNPLAADTEAVAAEAEPAISAVPLQKLLNQGTCLLELSFQARYPVYADTALANFAAITNARAEALIPFETAADGKNDELGDASATTTPVAPTKLDMDTHFANGRALVVKAIFQDLEVRKYLQTQRQHYGPGRGLDSDQDESDEDDLDSGVRGFGARVAKLPFDDPDYVAAEQRMRVTPASELLQRASIAFDQATALYPSVYPSTSTAATGVESTAISDLPLLMAHTLAKYLYISTTQLNNHIYHEIIRCIDKATTLDPNLQLDTATTLLYYRCKFFTLRAQTDQGENTDHVKDQMDVVISHLLKLIDPMNNCDGKGKQPVTLAHVQLQTDVLKLLGNAYLTTSMLDENEDAAIDRYDRGMEILRKARDMSPGDLEVRAQLQDMEEIVSETDDF